MKNVARFLWQYKYFTFALLGLGAGLALFFTGYKDTSKVVVSVVALLETLPLIWGMLEDVRSGKYGIDILALTAIITSVILGEYWAAIVVVLMLTGGESLEDYAEHRAQRELDTLLSNAPRKAHLLTKTGTQDVAVSTLKVGDKILIKPGEVVPVDARITEGSANLDESSLTGESLPQPKNAGDALLSGSIATDGSLTAQVTAKAADSQYQQIIKLVKNAANTESPFIRLTDRYSIPFTLSAYALAGGIWALTGDAHRFLEVIVVATPCPLLLAAPIALISGMSRASRYGIIVKTGSALERLAEAQSIAFDKTGTLTRGSLTLTEVRAFGAHTKDEVLGLAASLEQNSNHILAAAIIHAATEKSIRFSKAKHVQEESGVGVTTNVKGKFAGVGRASLLEAHGVSLPSSLQKSPIDQTAAYVVSGNELIGVLLFADEIRENAKATISTLHKLGFKNAMMVTGDHAMTARKVADELGIDTVHADALPADKLRALDELKQRPRIFVGDGVNDAPVLTAADIGIALGARGSTAASESADIVILADDVGRVATATSIARRTFKIARQSILIGIGISFGLMLFFATGKASPLAGAIAQEVVDVVVIIYALRAHFGKAELVDAA